MMYKKLKRTMSNGVFGYVPNIKEVFPELNGLSSLEMAARAKKLNLIFYHEIETPVSPLIRLTMPFAILTIVVMVCAIPIHFLITGKWRYNFTKENRLYNWFKSLRLV